MKLSEKVAKLDKRLARLEKVVAALVREPIEQLVDYILESSRKPRIIRMILEGEKWHTDIAERQNVDRTTIRDHIHAINEKAREIIGVPLIESSRSKGIQPTFLFDYVLEKIKKRGHTEAKKIQRLLSKKD